MKTYGPMARVSRARVKLVAAAVAAGVVATMGALTVALSGTEAHAVPAAITGADDTSTQAPPPPKPQITKAAPALKAPKWHGNGWPGL